MSTSIDSDFHIFHFVNPGRAPLVSSSVRSFVCCVCRSVAPILWCTNRDLLKFKGAKISLISQ